MTIEERKSDYLEAVGEAILQVMEKDKRVFLIGEGVDNIRGVYGTVLPAFRKFGTKRNITTPISENGMTGIAIGAALDGLRPVMFHSRNDFMVLAMDQLINHAAKLRYMSGERQRVPLTVVSFVARKVGEGAQHSQSLQSIFAHIPGLKVVMPTTPYDAKGLLIAAIEDDDPVIVLYHWVKLEGPVPETYYSIPLGQAKVRTSGRDLTIVAVSAAVFDCLKAAETLQDKISIEVIDLLSIRPFDKELIINSVVKTGRLLVVDTGWLSFGVSAEIVASVVEATHASLKAAPRRIGMVETPAPASPYLLKGYHPEVGEIVRTIEEMVVPV